MLIESLGEIWDTHSLTHKKERSGTPAHSAHSDQLGWTNWDTHSLIKKKEVKKGHPLIARKVGVLHYLDQKSGCPG